MEKVKTVVKIAGKEYTMAGYESEEYIHKVAIYVDRKMGEVERHSSNLSTNMIAVLTAVNIADELLKLQEQYERLKADYEALKEKESNRKNQGPNMYEITRKNVPSKKNNP